MQAHAALIATTLIYGFFYIAMKVLLRGLDDAHLVFYRIVLSALITGLIEWGFIRTRFASQADFWKTCAVGVLGILLVQSCVAGGLSRTSTFHTALLMATMPVFTLLFALLRKQEVFLWRKALGIVLAFTGVLLLVNLKGSGQHLPADHLWGDGLILLNSIGFALFLVLSKDLLSRYSAFTFVTYGYWASAVVMVVGIWAGWGVAPLVSAVNLLATLSVQQWQLMAFVVLGASILTYVLNQFALSRTSPSSVSLYVYMQPLLTGILGYVFLGEGFAWPMAVCGAITLGGVILANA